MREGLWAVNPGSGYMKKLETGLKGKMELTVGPEHLASRAGNFGSEVLSTHELVLLMELASREAVEGLLPEGKITVGTAINIRHFGAVPLGQRVKVEACLKEIQGKRLIFDVAAYDDRGKISEGENEQRIIDLAPFLKKVKEKAGHKKR